MPRPSLNACKSPRRILAPPRPHQVVLFQKIRAEMLGKDGWEDSKGVLHHQGHFGIEKTRELVAKKYYWETQRWKGLSMDSVTGLPISTDWKGTSYDSIHVVVCPHALN